MLKHQLIHPSINAILGRAGHHAKVLIADGNYPASSTLGPNAELVSLNLSPGIVTCAGASGPGHGNSHRVGQYHDVRNHRALRPE